MSPFRTALPALALLLPALAACGTGSDSGDARLRVVASTTQVADLAREVGGSRVEVHEILKPSSDPHGYEPRPSDAVAVARARVVFRSGGDVDGWLGDLLENAGGGARVVDLIDRVRTRRGPGGEVDPHWWQDPRNAVLAVGAIRGALARADPSGRRAYARNAARFAAGLRRLDHGIARCMARVPRAERTLVTTHDSLGYFAARYRIRIVGVLIRSLSTQAAPSARDVERLVDRIRSERVRTIFPETSLNPKLERAVAHEAGVRVGRPLWGDSLGPPDSDGATYLRAMASNAAAMVAGMTGGSRSCRPPT